MRDFFRLAYTARGNLGCHRFQDVLGLLSCRLGLGLCKACQSSGMRGSRQYIVHRDAKWSHFCGPCFGPVGDGPTDRIGHSESSEWCLHRRTDHIDDPAPTCFFHAGEHGLGQNVVVGQVLLKGREECIGVCF